MLSTRTKMEGERGSRKQETSRSEEKRKVDESPIIAEPFLPNDIIVEILSWLPVAPLLRCKCVSKQWNAMIQDQKFIVKHSNRASMTFHYTEACEGKTFTYLHASHGLMVGKSSSSLKYFIRNPATRRILDLPDPHKHVLFMALCFIPSTGNYKLVSVYSGKEASENGGCEIFTLDQSNDYSWRPLEVSNLHNLLKRREKISCLLDGNIFYLIRVGKDEPGYSNILCLNMESESITSIDIPYSFFSDWCKVWPLNWYGKLSLADIVEEELNIWVLEDCKKNRWAEKKIVIPLRFMKENPQMKQNLTAPSVEHGKVWFFADRNKMFSYDVESKETSYEVSAPKGKKFLCVMKPSLVIFKGMRPERQLGRRNLQKLGRLVGSLSCVLLVLYLVFLKISVY